jgi:hypothetical protein
MCFAAGAAGVIVTDLADTSTFTATAALLLPTPPVRVNQPVERA